MFRQGISQNTAVLIAVLAVSACGAKGANVSSQAPPAPTTADYYGSYEIILPSADTGSPGSEMLGTWDETGLTVTQMGNVVIRTQMSLGSNPGTMAIWDDADTNSPCAAEGQYSFDDDGRAITLTLLSDGCEGRSSSADGAQLVRLE
jgi:hypothetical protein